MTLPWGRQRPMWAWHHREHERTAFPGSRHGTRRFTLGGAPGRFKCRRTVDGFTFLRSMAGDDPVTCLWEGRRRHRCGAASSSTRGRSAGGRGEPAAGGTGPALSGCGKPPAGDRGLRDRCQRHAGRLRALRAACTPLPLGVTLTTGATVTPRLVPAKAPALVPRLDPNRGPRSLYVHDGGACASSTWRPAQGHGGRAAGRRDLRPGGSSSPPRRWAGPAATGGPRTARQLLVARVGRVRRGPLAHRRPPPTPGKVPAEVSYPAARHRQPAERVAAGRDP